MSTLKQYFTGIASKYLSVVDATPRSNQHEIGSNKFTEILGNPGSDKLRYEVTFLLFSNDSDEPETCVDTVTYYDTRFNQPKRAAEYRLYYRTNQITSKLRVGDYCVVAKLANGNLMIAFAPPRSENENRLRYLLGVDKVSEDWVLKTEIVDKDLNLATSSILQALGIDLIDPLEKFQDQVIARFKGEFPTTRVMSQYAQETFKQELDPKADPDTTLEQWMRREELLFRALEDVIVKERIAKGFLSTDEFMAYSLSVQNRRKSRVGHALENHLEAIFHASGLTFERGAYTEGNSKPDFLFPGRKAYLDPQISSPPLQMMAAKTTCKDRWRQILAEAKKIPKKHLFTLETAISKNQTDEMLTHNVQLVVPTSVQLTYNEDQQRQVIGLKTFINSL
jgi:EcoRII C terminal